MVVKQSWPLPAWPGWKNMPGIHHRPLHAAACCTPHPNPTHTPAPQRHAQSIPCRAREARAHLPAPARPPLGAPPWRVPPPHSRRSARTQRACPWERRLRQPGAGKAEEGVRLVQHCRQPGISPVPGFCCQALTLRQPWGQLEGANPVRPVSLRPVPSDAQPPLPAWPA